MNQPMRKKWGYFDGLVDAKGLRKWKRFAAKQGILSCAVSFYMPITNGLERDSAVVGMMAFKKVAQAQQSEAAAQQPAASA